MRSITFNHMMKEWKSRHQHTEIKRTAAGKWSGCSSSSVHQTVLWGDTGLLLESQSECRSDKEPYIWLTAVSAKQTWCVCVRVCVCVCVCVHVGVCVCVCVCVSPVLSAGCSFFLTRGDELRFMSDSSEGKTDKYCNTHYNTHCETHTITHTVRHTL